MTSSSPSSIDSQFVALLPQFSLAPKLPLLLLATEQRATGALTAIEAMRHG